jgi:hypothetical protein
MARTDCNVRRPPLARRRHSSPKRANTPKPNPTLLAMEALLDGEAEAITRVAVDKAKEGDTTALRLCLERILPPRKDRPVSFSLPQLGTVTDAPAATAAIVEKYGTVLSQAPFHSLIGDASERRTAVPCINQKLTRVNTDDAISAARESGYQSSALAIPRIG